MWIITHIHSGNKLYLISDVGKCVVGRVGSDIVLSDDSSISRSHAVFHIAETSLKLEDTGSKYGTYYNEHIETKTKLPKGKPVQLKEGHRVLFGALKNEWLISKNNITTMVSSLSVPQMTEVKSLMNPLGGKMVTKWEPSCTHLTMSEITITIKVLHALIEKIPIVSCEYWKNYLKDLRETKQPPKTSLYLPTRSDFLSSAIDVVHFSFNDKRKTLFAGKTFVFMSKRHCDTYSPIVLKAGGVCKDLKSNVHKSYLLQKDVIVVQYVPSTQSQSTQTINTISEYLEANSLRAIPEYEIGLAIVCCTTQTHCNPSFNPISNILPNSAEKTPNIGTILAENTRPQKSQFNTIELSTVEIPDSDCLRGESVPLLHSYVYEKGISESDSIPIENSENPDGMDLVSQISESNSSNGIKRKRDQSDENVQEKPTSKKLNIPSPDPFSGNLVASPDIISNVVPNSSEQLTRSTDKRKRQTTTTDNELLFSKKAHISPPCDDKNASEKASISAVKTAKNNISKKGIHSKTVQNPKDSSEPQPLAVPQIPKKIFSQPKNRHSGYLQKSQIANSQRETQVTNIGGQPDTRSGPLKRGRIARITDNDSDDEDDIFNFGTSAKKSATGHNSDDDLFAFGRNPSQDTVDRAETNSTELLPKTQPFIPNKMPHSKVIFPKIKVSPMKDSPGGWLSKLNSLKIKNENDNVIEKKDEDLKQSEWIDSIKGGFEVRVRKMDLSSKGCNYSLAQESSNSALNSTKKNFKAFVKKHNYKPQTLIVRTVPMVVPPIRY